MPGEPWKDARGPNSRNTANNQSRSPPFPAQGSPSEWPHARVELTKVTNVSLPRPRSSTSFKTESETSSPVRFYCRGIRYPVPYLTHAHAESLSHKASSQTLCARQQNQTLQNDNQECITHNSMHVILKVGDFLNCNLYIPIQ